MDCPGLCWTLSLSDRSNYDTRDGLPLSHRQLLFSIVCPGTDLASQSTASKGHSWLYRFPSTSWSLLNHQKLRISVWICWLWVRNVAMCNLYCCPWRPGPARSNQAWLGTNVTGMQLWHSTVVGSLRHSPCPCGQTSYGALAEHLCSYLRFPKGTQACKASMGLFLSPLLQRAPEGKLMVPSLGRKELCPEHTSL